MNKESKSTIQKVFIIYSRQDEEYKNELINHLIPLNRRGLLQVWNDRKITAGQVWEKEIIRNLKEANIIIPLVSSNFFASSYIDDVEMREAITRYHAEEVLICPIIIRPCAWDTDDLFSVLQVLPKNGDPIDGGHWKNKDQAWHYAVEEIKKLLVTFSRNQTSNSHLSGTSNFLEKTKDQINKTSVTQKQNNQKENTGSKIDFKDSRSNTRTGPFDEEINEEVIWKKAIGNKSELEIQNYLQKFPNGKYVRIANSLIEKKMFEKLKLSEDQEVLEQKLIDAIRKIETCTIEKCDEYLKRFPLGKYTKEVKNTKSEIIKNKELRKSEEYLHETAVTIDNLNICFEYLKFVKYLPPIILDKIKDNKVLLIKEILNTRVVENCDEDWKKAMDESKMKDYQNFIDKYESISRRIGDVNGIYFRNKYLDLAKENITLEFEKFKSQNRREVSYSIWFYLLLPSFTLGFLFYKINFEQEISGSWFMLVVGIIGYSFISSVISEPPRYNNKFFNRYKFDADINQYFTFSEIARSSIFFVPLIIILIIMVYYNIIYSYVILYLIPPVWIGYVNKRAYKKALIYFDLNTQYENEII